jgi:hypothetical protein
LPINQVLKSITQQKIRLIINLPVVSVYEPLSEDACAGLGWGLAFLGHDRFGVPMSHFAPKWFTHFKKP